MRRECHACIDVFQPEAGQFRRIRLGEGFFIVEIVVERRKGKFDRLGSLYDDGIVGLHIKPAPAEVGRAEHDFLRLRTIDDDHLVVLQALHMLAFHIRLAGRFLDALCCLGFAGSLSAMFLAVVDDDSQFLLQLLKSSDNLRFAEIVSDDANLGLFLDRLVEQSENGLAGLEAHPGQCFILFGMRRLEFEPLIGLRRKQCFDRSEFFITIHKGLRRNEAAGECDVDLAWISLAPKLDRGFLRHALAEPVFLVHEYRRDAVGKFAFEVGIAREMHPAKFLDWRDQRR
jgi:hypothetical protein